MKVFVGADHGGFQYKAAVLEKIANMGYEVEDKGAFALNAEDDYPEFAFSVAEAVAQESDAKGVLLCRSGAGMTIAANKVKDIRAVQVRSTEEVQHACQHNNANVITLSADWLSQDEVLALVEVFLSTSFSSEPRHQRRVAQISQYESK
jgi:ribose 5-phosphate isomerase B